MLAPEQSPAGGGRRAFVVCLLTHLISSGCNDSLEGLQAASHSFQVTQDGPQWTVLVFIQTFVPKLSCSGYMIPIRHEKASPKSLYMSTLQGTIYTLSGKVPTSYLGCRLPMSRASEPEFMAQLPETSAIKPQPQIFETDPKTCSQPYSPTRQHAPTVPPHAIGTTARPQHHPRA